MSDIHVLDGDGKRWRVVLHFAVPNTNNAVGVNHRTALVNSGLGGTTILTEGVGPGQITTAERALILAGAVYEHLAEFPVESQGTTAGGLTAMFTTFLNETRARVGAELLRRLRYYGHTRDIP